MIGYDWRCRACDAANAAAASACARCGCPARGSALEAQAYAGGRSSIVVPARAEPLERYATFWRRFVASVVDGAIVFVAAWPLDAQYLHGWPWLGVLVTLVGAALPVGYYVFFHARRGQTPGKMLMRVRVMDLSEARLPTVRQATLRSLPEIVMELVILATTLPAVAAGLDGAEAVEDFGLLWMGIALAFSAWYAAELLTLLLSAKRRALHDFIARTVVVRVDQPG